MQNQHSKYKIYISEEREFWKTKLIALIITIPKICPYYSNGDVGLKNIEKENHPLQGKCNYHKCTRNLNLRRGTIFEPHSKTPISVLYKVLKYWIN